MFRVILALIRYIYNITRHWAHFALPDYDPRSSVLVSHLFKFVVFTGHHRTDLDVHVCRNFYSTEESPVHRLHIPQV